MKINISDWVAKSKTNSGKYIIRQGIEILINAIADTKLLKANMYLKGGNLMAIAHQSQRTTGDVDFSWLEPFHKDNLLPIDKIINESLNESLNDARNRLGYLNFRCKVQTITKKPHKWNVNKKISFPALEITIGCAESDTKQAKLLEDNKCLQTFSVDISFNEEIMNCQELILDNGKSSINAYSPIEIIAEKFRALIQQAQRKRCRRQDVYDINFLINRFSYDEDEKSLVLKNLIVKSKSRNVGVDINSLSNDEIKMLSGKDWSTMKLELTDPLPDFNDCYENIKNFYISLPWR